MKNQIYILLRTVIILILSFHSIIAQTPEQMMKKKSYRTWVTPIDGSSKIKGYLSEIGDSLTIISDYPNYERQHIYINDVKEVKFRKDGKIGWGIFQGALTGLIIGGIIGFSEGSDTRGFIRLTAAEKATFYGTTLAIPGAIIGGIIGAAKIKIPITNNTKNPKAKLKRYKLSF